MFGVAGVFLALVASVSKKFLKKVDYDLTFGRQNLGVSFCKFIVLKSGWPLCYNGDIISNLEDIYENIFQ